MTVAVPAPLVAAGAGLPRVCARHGEPATRHRRVLFRSATPWWVYLLLPLGLLPFAIVAVVLQKQVKAPAWPLCPRCGRLRGRRAVAGVGCCLLAVVAVVALAGVVPSEYAVVAIGRYGILKGTALAAWRLLRCNPWSAGGVDHVEDQRVFRSRPPRPAR